MSLPGQGSYVGYAAALEQLNQPGQLLSTASAHATAHWDGGVSAKEEQRIRRVILRYLGDIDQYRSDGHCLILTGGPPGAGKSTLLEQRAGELGIDLAGFLLIDPDRLRSLLLFDMLERDELPCRRSCRRE